LIVALKLKGKTRKKKKEEGKHNRKKRERTAEKDT
jgi:hypothetical protein